MKFLHTSDLHLREKGDNRWKALETILKLAVEQNAELVLISGDLFDKDCASNILRSALRELFSQFPEIRIVIVPGNHDKDAFPEGVLWSTSKNVFPLTESPYQVHNYENITIFGIPYYKEENQFYFSDILRKITFSENKFNIVIVHGTLVGKNYKFLSGFGYEERYNPIFYDDLVNAPVDYFALGHIHQYEKKFILNQTNRVIASYPGSPVSIAKDETGPRKVVIGEIEGKKLNVYDVEIPTFFYLQEELTVIPTLEQEFLTNLKSIVEKFNKKDSCLVIKIGGCTVLKEQDLSSEIDKIKRNSSEKNIVWETYEFSMIDKKYENLIKEFLTELYQKYKDGKISSELRTKIQKTFYRSIAEL